LLTSVALHVLYSRSTTAGLIWPPNEAQKTADSICKSLKGLVLRAEMRLWDSEHWALAQKYDRHSRAQHTAAVSLLSIRLKLGLGSCTGW